LKNSVIFLDKIDVSLIISLMPNIPSNW